MKAWDKYSEAKYFLEKMKENISDPDAFRYNLSAFLAAARSITLILQKEFKNKKEGFNEWYDKKVEEMRKDELMKFMYEKRNVTIHEKPIKPLGRHSLSIEASVYIADSVEIKHIRNGKVIEERKIPPEPKEDKKKETVEVRHRYFFQDYPSGEKEIIPACEEYLYKLNNLLKEAEKLFG